MKKIFIHGGSSLISKYLVQKFANEVDEFYIFCRDKKKTEQILEIDRFQKIKFHLYENHLNKLDQTLSDLKKLPDDIDGILWVTGFTGDPDSEIQNIEKAKFNIEVNFVNVVISLTFLLKKINISNEPFICVISSVAGLRGRKKKLFYSASKGGLLNFLSGLRQKLNGRIKVISVIPGYMSTNSFTEDALNFLITSPEKTSNIIFDAIKKNKEIVYVSSIWRYIMWIVLMIPEKIYKKLKF
tara:strand:+ start:96 stop:818 length:723 start_codon:yes stop_codon:yes gene_type:complete